MFPTKQVNLGDPGPDPVPPKRPINPAALKIGYLHGNVLSPSFLRRQEPLPAISLDSCLLSNDGSSDGKDVSTIQSSGLWVGAGPLNPGHYAIIEGRMRSPTDNLQPINLTPEAIENCLDSINLPLLTALRILTRDRSLPVYLVGGPVRDFLLGLPVKDLDFAVEGDAPALARRLAEQLGGRVIVHRRFGTATVVRDGARLDLVTARREVYPRPGALPLVSPGSINDDLARRDFSVNALALSLTEEQPRLLDLHCGMADLSRQFIRTLHPESFADDPTRLLRAIRYEQRLCFQLEPDTEAQVHVAVAQGCLDTVSGDRLRHELERILDEEQPGRILVRAVELGILPAIHPALSRQDCLTRWNEASAQIAPEGDVQPLAWLAALSYPLFVGEVEGVIRRLNMPNSWAQVARDTVAIRELENEIADPTLAQSQLCRLLEGREPPAIQVAAGLTDSPATRRNLLRYLHEIRQVAPILNGRDLLAIGVPPGPPVGKALAQLRAARLDGRVNDEVEERQWVREYVRTETKGDW